MRNPGFGGSIDAEICWGSSFDFSEPKRILLNHICVQTYFASDSNHSTRVVHWIKGKRPVFSDDLSGDEAVYRLVLGTACAFPSDDECGNKIWWRAV